MLRLAGGLEAAADVQIDPSSHAPRAWDAWLLQLFPHLFKYAFAAHHREFWEWVDGLKAEQGQSAFFAVWGRGGAKTTSAEAAVVRLGARGTRTFCLYVRSVQARANESVRNIAAMLESRTVAEYYPLLASRKLSKYGFSQGWTADMLRCASGFSVIGLGFDAAVRGVKIEGARPDLIILDDIDDKTDSPVAVEKKINILTTSILPAGAPHAVVLGIQNLMHPFSIFARLARGEADFLHNRHISGPHPAVRDLTYEQRPTGGYRITGGTPTWEGQDLATCERQLNEWGPTAFLQEAQHEVEVSGGIWDSIIFQHADTVPDLVRGSVWLDPAVTSTDASDCQALQADGLGVDGKLYRLYSWEGITSPEEAVLRALVKCLEYGLDTFGIETDQGGDTWRSVFAVVWERLTTAVTWHATLLNNPGDPAAETWVTAHPELALVAPLVSLLARGPLRQPTFTSAKAGQGHGSKIARNQRMLVSYEQGRVIHVRGTHQALEHALKRFPNKPLDLADAAYWAWWDVLDQRSGGGSVGRLSDRSAATIAAAPDIDPAYVTLRYRGIRQFPLTIGKTTYMIEGGWQRQIERQVATSIVAQFPEHFEVLHA